MDNQMTTICPECSEEALLDDGDKCHNCGHKYEAPFAHQPVEMPADLEWSLECIDGNLSPDIGRTIRKYLSFPMRESIKEGYTLVPNKALEWLFGEGDSDFEPPPRAPRYWWRSVFRKKINDIEDGDSK